MKTAICASEQCDACAGTVFDGIEDRACGCVCHAPVTVANHLEARRYRLLPRTEPLAGVELCPRCAGIVRLERDGEVGCPVCGWAKPPAEVFDIPETIDRNGRKMRRREPSAYGMKL